GTLSLKRPGVKSGELSELTGRELPPKRSSVRHTDKWMQKRYSAGNAPLKPSGKPGWGPKRRRLCEQEAGLARRDDSPHFIEAIARGLDVIRAFGPGQPVMSLAAVAKASTLPRPTARRILLTLEQLGYVTQVGGQPGSGGHAGQPGSGGGQP